MGNLLALTGVGGQTYSSKVLGYNPIAYWPLWETSGLTAHCLVNSPAQDGTYTGVTLGQPGIGDGNTCPWFDGANDYVNIFSAALSAAFDGSEGTVMIWARVNNAAVWTNGLGHVALKLGEDANNYGRIRQKTAVNNQVSYIYIAGGVAEYVATAPHAETTWIHRAITWSSAANHFQPYYAGAPDGLGLGALGAYVGNLANGFCIIGAESLAPILVQHGWLARCAVFDRPLLPAEIADLAVV